MPTSPDPANVTDARLPQDSALTIADLLSKLALLRAENHELRIMLATQREATKRAEAMIVGPHQAKDAAS